MEPNALDRFSDRFLAPELRGDTSRETRRVRRLVIVVFTVVATGPALALLLWIRGATPWSTMVLLMALAVAVWTYETLSQGLRRRIARSDDALSSIRTAAEADCRELRWILDSSSLGAITLDPDGSLSLERSAAVDDLFGEPSLGAKLWDYLAPVDPAFASALENRWPSLRANVVPADLSFIQLPRKLSVRDRFFDVEYKRMHAGEPHSTILVLLTDVTADRARDRAELMLFETRSVLSQLHRDHAGVVSLFAEAGASVTRLTRQFSRFDRHSTLLEIEALRERADALGLASLAVHCQDLDGRIRDTPTQLTPDERASLLSAWTDVATRFEPWLGEDATRELHVTAADQESLRQAILGQAARTELLWLVDRWKQEPAMPRFLRLAETARATARRVGRGDVTVTVSESDARIDPAIAGKFWGALTQTVREALEAGLYAADEQSPMTMHLRAFETEGETVVEVSDGGSWLDWCAREDVIAKLRTTCEAASGTLRLMSEPSAGTTIQCRLPIMGARLSVTLPPMTVKKLWKKSLPPRALDQAERAAG